MEEKKKEKSNKTFHDFEYKKCSILKFCVKSQIAESVVAIISFFLQKFLDVDIKDTY